MGKWCLQGSTFIFEQIFVKLAGNHCSTYIYFGAACPKLLKEKHFLGKLALRWAITGHGSSIGSEFAWHASCPEFDPHVRHILPWRPGHENISMAILSLSLIQEEQLSVTGERMCTKYW